MSMARGCLLLLAFATAWGTSSGVLLAVTDRCGIFPRGVWMPGVAVVGGLALAVGLFSAIDRLRHRPTRLERGPDSLADSKGPTAYLAAVTELVNRWDTLIRDHPGKCVAVRGDGWFVVANDSAQLHARLTENGVSSDVVETRWLLPHMAPARGRKRSSAA
jgi:hypothetical protein